MTTNTLSVDSPTSPAELATFGPVHLDVTDADRSLAFWRDLIGLQIRHRSAEAIALGTEFETLLVLHPGATAPALRGFAGLYHLAIHLPDEHEFARVLARLIAHRVPIAPTDHVMSMAIYLDDPDGIGLELALETPERMRSARVTASGPEIIDASGRRRGGRDPLDVERVLAALTDQEIERPLPVGTKIGHVHLHVGELDTARRFYRDRLGFLDAMEATQLGIVDFHADGRFKHRIAINTWQGNGVSQAPPGTAGLRHFTIRFDSDARLQTALRTLPDAAPHAGGHLVRDPSGNAIVLTA